MFWIRISKVSPKLNFTKLGNKQVEWVYTRYLIKQVKDPPADAHNILHSVSSNLKGSDGYTICSYLVEECRSQLNFTRNHTQTNTHTYAPVHTNNLNKNIYNKMKNKNTT